MVEYLGKINIMLEELTLEGQPVIDNEFVLITLEGMVVEYENFITTVIIEVNRSSEVLTFSELQGMLIEQA